MTAPLPLGFKVELEPSTVELAPGRWLGGRPMRVVRVTPAGRPAWEELRNGPVSTRAGGTLGRRLVDAGLAHPVPPPLTYPPDITVVIPVRDRPGVLDRCLDALDPRYLTLVIDDASTAAGEIRRVAERHDAHLIRLDHNRGPAAARSAGLAAVRTDLVAFLDSDTVSDGDWIAELAAHLQDLLVAAAAPRIVASSAGTWAGQYTAARTALDLGNRPASVRPYTEVSYVPTAAMVARRGALASIDGPFDPTLRVGEDVDLVWRLLTAGWRVRYQPDVAVQHVEPESWPGLLRRRHRYGTSSAALAKRHPANIAPFLAHPWFTATALAAAAGRPDVALAAAAGSLLSTRRAVERAGLPSRRALSVTRNGLRQTWLGLGRYATQFAAPILIAAMLTARPARRAAAASLLFAPPIAAWLQGERRLDLGRYVLGSVADDIAYGSGVLAGCLRERTVRPLTPQTTSRSRS